MSEPQLNTAMLLLKQEITLDVDTLLKALQTQFTDVEIISKSDDEHMFLAAFAEYTVEYTDAHIPAQIAIFQHKNIEMPPENLTPYLQQTWDWNEAESVVEHCPHTMMVTDMMATALEYHKRLELFQKAMAAILTVVPCEAIAWRASQKLVNPEKYLLNYKADNPDPLYGALNVRMFRIQDTEPEQVVMDTVGLSIFGLPDLQCHFVKLEPSRVAGLLAGIGHYIFERGDVIQDGETVQGLSPEDKWICRHEVALVAPEREVLDINPGGEFAAGTRG